jgi:hypothetical protein
VSERVTLLFYDKNGNQVAEGSAESVVQFRSDDPARPDAKAADSSDNKALSNAPEDKSRPLSEPRADTTRRRT